ncbi:MAG: hypothetical protein ABIR66_09950 [Saprospiraceae bacterium]
MKTKTLLYIFFFGIWTIFQSSCKKEVEPGLGNSKVNHPPIANAGTDQTLLWPKNETILDAIGSSDPDNNIIDYIWTKISGPSWFDILEPHAIHTRAINLGTGTYQFELTVIDAGQLRSKDTMQVKVLTDKDTGQIKVDCNEKIRPQINAELIPIGSLSQIRQFIALVSAGSKIFFAGGDVYLPPPNNVTSRVDIYDVNTHTWSTAELSVPRSQIATVAAGNKVFFAGGVYYTNPDEMYLVDRVDIYDVTTNTWSIDSLRGSGGEIAAATVGNKVFFAGYNQIDIYDLSTNTWSVSVLSEKRLYPTAVSTNNKVFFGGGSIGLQASNKIDIYDLPTDSWSISTLSEARYDMAGIAVAGKVYWAGGSLPSHGNNEQAFSCTVEIKDISSSSSSFASLFKPRDFFSYAGRGAVLKDDKIIFYINSSYLYLRESFNRFDIYDITNKTWTVGVLNQYIGAASIISVNNTIYIVGGNVNGTLNNQVWKLKF